jgi:saccharopine dehydrogenase (NAD+, L-lysine forming)
VEKCGQRIFTDQEYVEQGCEMVEKGTWKTESPNDAIVIGLKELPEGDQSPLKHTHIFFAYCYKCQALWRDILPRFDKGNGVILDLEFLADGKGRRSGIMRGLLCQLPYLHDYLSLQ